MKKFLVFVIIIASIFALTAQSCGYSTTTSGTAANEAAARETATASVNAVRVPQLTHFPERQTIATWAETFDTPQITCYLYLISHGQIIGYYVTNGKPASTQSYLTPGYRERAAGEGRVINEELPDIDGTYGDNNPGIRFFTASGIAVEWAGYGATYIFSTRPIPGNFIELGR